MKKDKSKPPVARPVTQVPDKDDLHDISAERMIPEVRESDLPDTGRSNLKDAGLHDDDMDDRLDEK